MDGGRGWWRVLHYHDAMDEVLRRRRRDVCSILLYSVSVSVSVLFVCCLVSCRLFAWRNFEGTWKGLVGERIGGEGGEGTGWGSGENIMMI